MLRWALDIRPGSKWLESKVERQGDKGFRLQTWNRLPQNKPTVKVTGKEVGLKSDAEVLTCQLDGAAFRLPAEFEVSWKGEAIALKVGKPAKVRLDYGVLRPEWTARGKPVLQKRRPGSDAVAVRDGVVWNDNSVEWQAAPGDYELRLAGK
jgi:hypothetical protein